jgi:CHAT domain-containing protein
MRKSQPNHRQQLGQNPTSQKRQNHQQKHLNWMLARIAVNIPEKLLDRADHALDEALARPSPARRGREG